MKTPLSDAASAQAKSSNSPFDYSADLLESAARALRGRDTLFASARLHEVVNALALFNQESWEFADAYLDSVSIADGGQLLLRFRQAEQAAIDSGKPRGEAGAFAVREVESYQPALLRLQPDDYRQAILREAWCVQSILSAETEAQCAAISELITGGMAVPAIIRLAVRFYLHRLNPASAALPPDVPSAV